jgi:hypothetical protein
MLDRMHVRAIAVRGRAGWRECNQQQCRQSQDGRCNGPRGHAHFLHQATRFGKVAFVVRGKRHFAKKFRLWAEMGKDDDAAVTGTRSRK